MAVELARAGFFVYATGRSSRATGPSEIGRPETIEESGDLVRAAGGAGAARVVDHEDPSQVAALVAAIDDERGRLGVLVNDIFGGDRYMQWDKPLWEHDLPGGLLQIRVHPGPAGDRDVLADQVRQAAAPGQGHDRDQAGQRHEIRVIKRYVRLQPCGAGRCRSGAVGV